MEQGAYRVSNIETTSGSGNDLSDQIKQLMSEIDRPPGPKSGKSQAEDLLEQVPMSAKTSHT